MKSTRFSLLFNFTFTLALLAGAAGLMFSQNGGQPRKPNSRDPKDSASRSRPSGLGPWKKSRSTGNPSKGTSKAILRIATSYVYLPPSYTKNRNQRYPVVYFLHGYGAHAETYVNAMWASDGADKDVAAGTSKEMIIVFPDSYTIYDGSMYSNSPTTGNWETFITEDLVQLHRQPLPHHCRSREPGPRRALHGRLRHAADRHEVSGNVRRHLPHELVLPDE